MQLYVHSSYDVHGHHTFSLNWEDLTHRYHIWVSIRPDVDGERVPYPVKIGETIYKNKKGEDRASRLAPTIQMDLNAKKNAKLKAEAKRLARYDDMVAMFNDLKAGEQAKDEMWAEADYLNRLFDAIVLVNSASQEELTLFTSR